MNNFNYRLNRFLDEELSIKWVIIGIFLYIYGFRMRSNLFILSNSESKLFNNWDLIVNFFSDLNLQIYFISPILLFLSLKIIHLELGFPLLIRLGSYKNWIIHSVIQFIKKLFIITCIMVIIISLLLIGVPLEFKWSLFSTINEGLPNNLPSNVISKYIRLPGVFLFFQLTLFFLFFIVVHLFLVILYVYTKSRLYPTICAIMTWVLFIVSFKLFPASHPTIILPSYFNLIQGIKGFGNTWTPFFIVILGLFLLSFLTSKIDKKFKRKSFTFNSKYALYCILVLLSLLPILRQTNIRTIQEIYILAFYGTSQIGFNFLAFMSYLIIFYGYVLLTLLSLNKELDNLSYYKVLRYGNLIKWIWNSFVPILKSNFFLLLYLFSFVLLISFLCGVTLNDTFSSNKSSSLLIFYHFFINGYLQILFYILFAFLIGWYTKNMFYGFFSIITLSIFMLPGLNLLKFIPSGLNSMGYLLDGGSPYITTFILLLYLIVLIGLIYLLLNKKDYDI
ncbi:MAG TPA: hypothetical protein VNS08_09365 [Ureibacillus sp.]|nr:hypothetical protein [Ureibacillus sp.]